MQVPEPEYFAEGVIKNKGTSTKYWVANDILLPFLKQIIIDDVAQDDIKTNYTLSLGEHTIKYIFIGKSLPFGCFGSVSNLKSLSISEGVTELGGDTFVNSELLQEVFLPKSLISTLYGFSFNHTLLTSINYAGTINEWNEIIEPDFYNSLHNYSGVSVIHCSDGDVNVE